MFTKEKSAICKGMAILLLLFHHLFYSPKRVSGSGMIFSIIPYHFYELVGVASRICVWMFVLISAYGLTLSYQRASESQRNRFPFVRWLSLLGQFHPAYVVMCILMAIDGVDAWAVLENSPLNLFVDSFALADFFHTPSLCNVWWYMCLAQVIVIAIPFVNIYCNALPFWPGMFLGFILIQFCGEGIVSKFGGEYLNYFLCVLMGCYAAREGLFDRAGSCFDTEQAHRRLRILLLFILLIVTHAILYKLKPIDTWHVRSFIQAFAAFGMCLFASVMNIPMRIRQCLQFLGKHSGNIFLVHAFFYTYTKRLIYWSRNPLVSYCCLLLVSVITSCILELFKDKTGYTKLVRHAINLVNT